MQNDLFLPPPRVPVSQEVRKGPDPGWLDSISPGAGEPQRTYLAQVAEVNQAVRDLESARPGGDAWREAQGKDAAAVVAGKEPKTWAVGTLLAGEHQRWARASALARTITRRVVDVPQELAGNEALVKSAVALLDEEKSTLARTARDAYVLASSGKSEHKTGAWKSLGAAKTAHAEAGRLLGLLRWLDGTDPHWDATGWMPATWSPESAGEFAAASILLGDQGRMLTLPKGIVWPRGFDPSSGLFHEPKTYANLVNKAGADPRARL